VSEIAALGRPCIEDPEAAEYDSQKAAEETWDAFLTVPVFVERPDDDPFILASETTATIKADAKRLGDFPDKLSAVLGHMSIHPCLLSADVLIYVPDGMRKNAIHLGQTTNKRVVHIERVLDSSSRYAFRYSSPEDQELALAAERVCIVEDVVTTLGSVHGVARLLRPEQDIHSLAMLLRHTVNSNYLELIRRDHYLLKRFIPTDKHMFINSLSAGDRAKYERAKQKSGE
jgi:hypothetical protein